MNTFDPYLIFISHASEDMWIATQMAHRIKERTAQNGVTVFVDELSLRGGDHFRDEIKSALRECKEMIVLLSPASINEDWVMLEIGAVAVQEKRITAIMDKLDYKDVPDAISDRIAIPLNKFDRFLEELQQRTT
jgi:hypothetical protein